MLLHSITSQWPKVHIVIGDFKNVHKNGYMLHMKIIVAVYIAVYILKE